MWLLGKLAVQSLGALGVVVAPATVPRGFRPLDEGMTCVPGSQEGVPVLLLETTLLSVHTCAVPWATRSSGHTSNHPGIRIRVPLVPQVDTPRCRRTEVNMMQLPCQSATPTLPGLHGAPPSSWGWAGLSPGV